MVKKLLPVIIIILGSFAGILLLRHYDINLATLQAQQSTLSEWQQQHYWLAPLLFFIAYILVVAFSLPIASLMSLSSGFLFGMVFGGILTILGATTGAVILFKIAQTSFGSSLRQKATQSGGLYQKLARQLEHNSFANLMFLRLVPIFPFFLVNIGLALTGVSTRMFFITTLLGIMPASFIFANLGQELGKINSLNGLISKELLLALTALGLLMLVPNIYQAINKKFKNP